jgi:murein DD-endopeptidase MepM/ murein hydrolase activator NlpD
MTLRKRQKEGTYGGDHSTIGLRKINHDLIISAAVSGAPVRDWVGAGAPMSYRHSDRRHGSDLLDPAAPRFHPRAAAMGHHSALRADYTLGHAGRQVRLGPVAFWTVVGTLVIMAVWTVATATYFAFRDDLLTRLIARQAEMQYAYEDRVAELRSQVDRLTSRQLLDQEQFEQKLDHLMRRQGALESRTSTLSGVADPAPTGAIKPRATDIAPAKPSPISDTVTLVPPPDREARLESRAVPAVASRVPASKSGAGIEARLAQFQDSLDRVEARHASMLNGLEESFDAKARRMRSVLGDLGVDVGKMPAASIPAATGGPFVPLAPRGDGGAFDRQLYRISLARAQVEQLNRALVAVPIRKPLAGEIETTSGFGVRMDPFVRSLAMHTGVDIRSNTGEPVRATAAGKVVSAGWSGGYGKMVEIDHGNGLSTRYGHLSAIDVSEGQTIRVGQVVGRVGSTGRSTGPHLHYETRLDGDAVDPQKYLRAAIRLGGI